MAIWGIISAATAGCHSYRGLLAGRFFLGFVEAAYFVGDMGASSMRVEAGGALTRRQPGCLYYLSCWYTRRELGLRTAYMYAGVLLADAFSGLLAAAITNNLDGTRGLRAWRWLFLIEGVVTVAVALVAFFALPDLPRTTGWLSEEAALAAWRLEKDIGQDDWVNAQDQSLWHGFQLAIGDAKTWIFVGHPSTRIAPLYTPWPADGRVEVVIQFGQISAHSVNNFFPKVVATLRQGPVATMLLTVPPYVVALVTSLANAWHADRTGERCLHLTLPLCVAVAAFVVAAATTSTAARYASMMLMVSSGREREPTEPDGFRTRSPVSTAA